MSSTTCKFQTLCLWAKTCTWYSLSKWLTTSLCILLCTCKPSKKESAQLSCIQSLVSDSFCVCVRVCVRVCTKVTSRFWSLIKHLSVLYYKKVSFSLTREIIISFSINFEKRKKWSHSWFKRWISTIYSCLMTVCDHFSSVERFTLPQKKG